MEVVEEGTDASAITLATQILKRSIHLIYGDLDLLKNDDTTDIEGKHDMGCARLWIREVFDGIVLPVNNGMENCRDELERIRLRTRDIKNKIAKDCRDELEQIRQRTRDIKNKIAEDCRDELEQIRQRTRDIKNKIAEDCRDELEQIRQRTRDINTSLLHRRCACRDEGLRRSRSPTDENVFESDSVEGADLSLPLVEFSIVFSATNSFSDKLGEGGFGPVYKGILPDGQEIAIKVLSKNSSQGLEEFKNEVMVLSKLQHRNLVRLFGCCVHGEEKMLLYEYMPNKSLDSFIFDESKREVLGWELRFKIILGIARGLLYLHQDSRLKIIHRDLKASNVLLDDNFNPKISDFGMARIFGEYQLQALTHRIVGTYGYISPEYAMEGKFSEKSDVFSFGVLILEIVSGRRNNSFVDHEWSINLLGYAWTLWKEGSVSELIDPLMGTAYSYDEICRCIQVGLLCVQELPADRPTMSPVLRMLGGDVTLPSPKQAAFFVGRAPVDDEDTGSGNQLTNTELEGR